MKFSACLSPIASLILPGTGQIFSGYMAPGLMFFGFWLVLGQVPAAVSNLGVDARHAIYFAALGGEVLLRLGSAFDVFFRQQSRGRGQGPRQQSRLAMTLLFCVFLLALAAVPTPEPILKAYAVNGNRPMLPLIAPDSRLLVDTKVYQVLKPQKDDIVIVSSRHATRGQEAGRPIVGRVEGVAGEYVQVPDPMGLQSRGGEGKGYQECIVAEGSIYLMDSNAAGQRAFFAPLASVIGRVEYVYWPPSQMGRIRGRAIQMDADSKQESVAR